MVNLLTAFGAAVFREAYARAAERDRTIHIGLDQLGLPAADVRTVIDAWDLHYSQTGEPVDEEDIRSALGRAARGGLEWRPWSQVNQ